MWHEFRRQFWSGDLSGITVPEPEDFSAGHKSDVEAALVEAIWRPKLDARPFPRDLSSGRLGLPYTASKILLPLARRTGGELQWVFENFDPIALQPLRYRTSATWRPRKERADFTGLLSAFVETGDKWNLAPIIFSGLLSHADNRAEFADALHVKCEIGHGEIQKILAEHATGAPRKTYDVIDALKMRKRREPDGSLARGGRRARALCLGPTVHEFRDWASSLKTKTEIPVQDIERAAKRIGIVRARRSMASTR